MWKEWWSINKVIITGRLTAKPDLRYTQSNNAVTTFTVATNRLKRQDGKQEADFINCRVWNKQAENLCKYQDKGNLILVDGSIRVDSYIGNDGSKKYTTCVLANHIEYLESKLKNETVEEVHEETHDPFSDFGEQVSIDDMTDNFLD